MHILQLLKDDTRLFSVSFGTEKVTWEEQSPLPESSCWLKVKVWCELSCIKTRKQTSGFRHHLIKEKDSLPFRDRRRIYVVYIEVRTANQFFRFTVPNRCKEELVNGSALQRKVKQIAIVNEPSGRSAVRL